MVASESTRNNAILSPLPSAPSPFSTPQTAGTMPPIPALPPSIAPDAPQTTQDGFGVKQPQLNDATKPQARKAASHSYRGDEKTQIEHNKEIAQKLKALRDARLAKQSATPAHPQTPAPSTAQAHSEITQPLAFPSQEAQQTQTPAVPMAPATLQTQTTAVPIAPAALQTPAPSTLPSLPTPPQTTESTRSNPTHRPLTPTPPSLPTTSPTRAKTDVPTELPPPPPNLQTKQAPLGRLQAPNKETPQIQQTIKKEGNLSLSPLQLASLSPAQQLNTIAKLTKSQKTAETPFQLGQRLIQPRCHAAYHPIQRDKSNLSFRRQEAKATLKQRLDAQQLPPQRKEKIERLFQQLLNFLPI